MSGAFDIVRDEIDTRPILGHNLLDPTAIYNKVGHDEAVPIATRRREHVAEITKNNGSPE